MDKNAAPNHDDGMIRTLTLSLIGASVLVACTPQQSASNAATPPAASPAEIHKRLVALDTHLDTPVHFARPGWNFGDRHSLDTDVSQVDLPRMAEAGLDGGYLVIYTKQGDLTPKGYAEALAFARKRQAEILATAKANKGRMVLVTTADQAESAAKKGIPFFFQSIENSWPLGEDLALLEEFWKNGVRMAGPVHSKTNQFADSTTGEAKWGGLSPLGEKWLAECNRLGIVVDASHSSDATFDDMLEQSATPIILSHSGPKWAFDHKRNLDDDRIRKLAAEGGVIAVNSIFLAPFNNTPERDAIDERLGRLAFMTPEEQVATVLDLRALDARQTYTASTFDQFMASLLHLIEVAGVDHVAFGADWDGGGGVEGMRDITMLPKITERLLAAGYTKADLQKMWSGNVLRLVRQAEQHAAKLAKR